MREYLYPIVGTVVSAIIIALASLFGDVQHNSSAVKANGDTLVVHRKYILENHDEIIKLKEHNKYVDKHKE
jgi:uncharacterized membrane protein YdbT with pleckstrin-like domain